MTNTDKLRREIRYGDLVVPVSPFTLFSSSGFYDSAICVSVDPFVLVSVGGDMIWRDCKPHRVQVVERALDDAVFVAIDRYLRDQIEELQEPRTRRYQFEYVLTKDDLVSDEFDKCPYSLIRQFDLWWKWHYQVYGKGRDKWTVSCEMMRPVIDRMTERILGRYL